MLTSSVIFLMLALCLFCIYTPLFLVYGRGLDLLSLVESYFEIYSTTIEKVVIALICFENHNFNFHSRIFKPLGTFKEILVLSPETPDQLN